MASEKRYIFDTECSVFEEGIRVRARCVIHDYLGAEIPFPFSEWEDNFKTAVSSAYDLYISELAASVKRRDAQVV
jgi:hypothetical protein